MATRRNYEDLRRLARERGYTVRREGFRVFWWRNDEPGREWESHGIASAWEDIALDDSLRNSPPADHSPPREKAT